MESTTESQEARRFREMFSTATSTGQMFSYLVFSLGLMFFNFNMFPYLSNYVGDKNYQFVELLFIATQHVCLAIVIMSFTLCILIPATYGITGSYQAIHRRYNEVARGIYCLSWFAGCAYFVELMFVLFGCGTFPSVLIVSCCVIGASLLGQAVYSIEFIIAKKIKTN